MAERHSKSACESVAVDTLLACLDPVMPLTWTALPQSVQAALTRSQIVNQPTPVVPCDDAAIERAATKAEAVWPGWHPGAYRQLAEDMFAAARETE